MVCDLFLVFVHYEMIMVLLPYKGCKIIKWCNIEMGYRVAKMETLF